jgi:ATP-binding cassette, subfamily C, bacterial LapB
MQTSETRDGKENPTESFIELPARAGDLLTECLLFVAKHHGRPLSAFSLLAGVPLDKQGRLAPGQVQSAARNAGLAARIVRSTLAKVAQFALPAVLFLKDDQACILLATGEETCTVAHPGLEESATEIPREELEQLYSGFVLYLLPSRRKEAWTDARPEQCRGHWFWSVLLRNWRPYSQVMVAAFVLNLCALATPLFVMNVYDRVVPNKAMDTLWVLATGMGVVFLFDFIIKSLRAYFIDTTGKQIDIELEGKLFDQILGIQLKDKPASTGAFANLLREMEVLRDFFTSATLVTFVDLPFIILFIALFWYIGGPIAFVFMAILPLTIAIGLAVHYPIKHSVESAVSKGHGKHAVLVETLSTIETVKSLGCESAMRNRWTLSAADNAKHAVRTRSLSHLAMNLTGFVQQSSYVIIIIVGVYLIKEGALTMGGLIACSILSGRVMAPFAQIAQLITRLHHTTSAYKELDKVMSVPGERKNPEDFLHRPHFEGEVEFRDVSFAYPEAKVSALRNVNLKIRAGERVGIIGRTGSGKTTLGKLLMSLYIPNAGSVLLDGTDIRQIDPADLRRWIGYVPQDVTLFQGDVRQNICVAHPQAADQEILQAAIVSGTHDFIRTHPQGYGLSVGERGCNLSGGQRQTISIARALLRNPSVLVLDEPTSSMDAQSEYLFVKRLGSIAADKTLVVITHRPTLLEHVDRLIVLDEGQVVADGPKEEVLQRLHSGKIPAARSGPSEMEANQ